MQKDSTWNQITEIKWLPLTALQVISLIQSMSLERCKNTLFFPKEVIFRIRGEIIIEIISGLLQPLFTVIE